MRVVGSFEYDAIAAIGLLACQVAPTGPLPEDFGTLVWEAKEKLTFEGLSGTVRFDAIGNRGAGGALMNNLLLDESDGSWREALVATVRGEWEWVGGSFEASGAVFGNNGAEMPRDDLTVGSSEVSLSVIVAVTAVAFMLLLIAGVLLLCTTLAVGAHLWATPAGCRVRCRKMTRLWPRSRTGCIGSGSE